MSEKIKREALRFLGELVRFIQKLFEDAQPKHAVKIQIVFEGECNMTPSVNLLVGQTVPFFITGTDANGVRTGSLLAGALLALSLSDDSGVSFVQDAVAADAPDGGPSIASGVLTGLAIDTDTLQASVTNEDGSVGPSTEATVIVGVVVVAPGPATALGVQFGAVSTPAPSAAAAFRARAGKQPSKQFPTPKQ